ncbi:toprim domain-containing protein [Heliobacillus mobilis]|uniref:Toprim domain-containing protein n=1 Tax=Heliobacterium mobile TaxID=28064 RepID=A0A6I3SQ03_HELMO|nr:toprim domain-containing protein [Heliobacterium mobile]MTV50775.1 toprim domain-containing protein [Heliobacterium mobile]
MITVHGFMFDVDVVSELQFYDWVQPRWVHNRLLACSPFRPERHPSFAVRLDTGVWIDSGSDDETWRKGSFVKLLSYLRNETIPETEEYLLSKYFQYLNSDSLELSFSLALVPGQRNYLSPDVLKPFMYRHPYLLKERGIEEDSQRMFRIGYSKSSKAITLPWFNKTGRLVNVKFRSVTDKRFWYHRKGLPVRDYLYGLQLVHQRKEQIAFLVESEIDAITLWQAGYAAVALGGANMSSRQRELLIHSPVEELVIATDNDQAGARIAESVANELNGLMFIKKINLPSYAKDVNDVSSDDLHNICSRYTDPIQSFLPFH